MADNSATVTIPQDLIRLMEARHHDPFAVLGRHTNGGETQVRAFLPSVASVSIEGSLPMTRVADTDVFEWRGDPTAVPEHYRLTSHDADGNTHTVFDPYCFSPQIGDLDIHLFAEGRHWHIYRVLGAHEHRAGDVSGVLFATWAPNAERVSIVGDFNQWDGRRHPMRSRGSSGVWELFVPGLSSGERYKFEVRNSESGQVVLKSDPYAQSFEVRPNTASLVPSVADYQWADDDWITARKEWDWQQHAMSIYEVHLGSWQRGDEGTFLDYRELAEHLIPYVQSLGFTHVELLPVTEHPLDASWGYQTIGYYAPTSRFGTPDDFRYFVDKCHQAGIGVLLDWAPGHFPRDEHGLAQFDGTALYEHADPRLGEHQDWGTLIFNYGRNEVKNFLLANAVYWLEEFHLDGLRVDAVASMLYLDYSREDGDWLPNRYGGNENLEAIDFLRELNAVTHGEHPGTVMMAEESTAWPLVTRPTWVGGLGFSMKWNMGWMHDSLLYMSKDPVHRPYHHDQLTFGLLYAFNENFVLPFSHDEVVHGKGSLLERMPGDGWQKFANLRLLYTFMWTYPGKKLLFMGCEFGQGREWDHDGALDWHLLDIGYHKGTQTLVRDLNILYQGKSALHQRDFAGDGFEWIDCHDASQSVISYVRRSAEGHVVVILNFTPIPRSGYRIGVPQGGRYREILNSDSAYYGGSDMGNGGELEAEPVPWMSREHSLVVSLPPLAALVLAPEPA